MKRLSIALLLMWVSIFGESWTTLDVTFVFDIEFHPDSAGVMFIADARDGVYKSYDYGETIDTLITDVRARDITFHPYSPDTFFVACGSGISTTAGILKVVQTNEGYEHGWSHDGIIPGSDGSIRTVKFLPGSDQVMFATTAQTLDGKLYRSNNGGRTWEELEVPMVGHFNFLEMDPYNIGTMYYGPSANFIYKSTDSGDNWTEVDYGGIPGTKYPTALDINPQNSSILYLSVPWSGLFKSTDGGSSWISISDKLPSNVIFNLVIDQNDPSDLYITTLVGVFYSFNGGIDWVDYTYNLGPIYPEFLDIWLDPESKYLYSVAPVYDLKRLDLNTIVSVKETESMLPSQCSLEAYPNPFNPTTTISYELPEQFNVTLNIYDIQGRNIQTLVYGSKPAGHYETQWNGGDSKGKQVAAGMYFARLEAGEHVQSIKMVYLR